MRILADANMNENAVALLRDGGHDVVWVKEEQPRALDPNVLAWSTREERLLITFDKDFGELTQRRQLAAPHGIFLFRIPDEIPPDEATVLIAQNTMASLDWAGYLWVINIRKRLATG